MKKLHRWLSGSVEVSRLTMLGIALVMATWVARSVFELIETLNALPK